MDVSPTWAALEAAESEVRRAEAAFLSLGDPSLLARLSGGRLDEASVARAAGAMASAAATLTADAAVRAADDAIRAETVSALVALSILPRGR